MTPSRVPEIEVAVRLLMSVIAVFIDDIAEE